MIITDATLNDAADLIVLAKVLGYETDELTLKTRLEKIIVREDNCLLVAKEGDQVIGYCHGYVRVLVEVKDAVEIGGLAVLEQWQGKGVAKKLVTGIEKWAIEKGYMCIVLSSNTMRLKAHGFYEHIGYKKVKQQFAFEKRLI